MKPNSSDYYGYGLGNNPTEDLLEEVIDFVSRNFLVLVAVQATEGSIGLKLRDFAKNLSLSLDFELSVGYGLQEVAQVILCVQTQHLSCPIRAVE